MDEIEPRDVGSTPDRPELELFLTQWQLYRKVVDHDYFHTSTSYRILRDFLITEFPGPFRFLDLACGDASGVVSALRGTTIARYRGVDLSHPALELARTHLADLPCPVELEHGDFTLAAKDASYHPDVVWFGLSLHHLETESKLDLMRDVRACLAEGGAFLIYEPTLRDDEDRDAYLDRVEALAREHWTACTREEVDLAMRHMRGSDLPETQGDWMELARRAGFPVRRELFRPPTDYIRLYAFRA